MASSSLRLPLRTLSDHSPAVGRRRRRRWRPLPCGLPLFCVSANSDGQDIRNTNEPQTLLIERYGNGMAKRYVMDSESQLRTVLEDHVDVADRSQTREDGAQVDWIPYFLKDFVLPAGFPGSVSEDYLDYMLLQFPTNVTGWICHTLVASSLLKAVGIGTFTGTSAAASAAAIRWVSKDGLGAIGRLFIGGRFGNLFDDDPKKWRMYADFIGSAGSIFELATPLAPSYFLPLASVGNLLKVAKCLEWKLVGDNAPAVARGLKDPSFRVIQNHFAKSGNLGDVAAKEEVWEVAAQLVGLAFGILIIDLPGLQISYSTLVATWLTLRILHLWLRYQSLSALRFDTINLKRARLLVELHVKSSVVPGYVECNREENILSWEKFSKPRIVFGTPMEDMLEGNISSYLVRELLELYAREKYLLVVRQQQLTGELEFYVSFKVGATGLSVLRSVWQSYWLFEHWEGSNNIHAKLEQSLLMLDEKFSDFMHLLNDGKWDTSQINLKVPKDIAIELVSNVQ